MLRLNIWTGISVLMLLVSIWQFYRDYRWWASRRKTSRPGVRWIHHMRIGSSSLMLLIWVMVCGVGILGFYPALVEYRSWFMLVTVLLLACHQVWGTCAWEYVTHLAGEEEK
jgi:hypothetical protein